jgi:hypothetical protein
MNSDKKRNEFSPVQTQPLAGNKAQEFDSYYSQKAKDRVINECGFWRSAAVFLKDCTQEPGKLAYPILSLNQCFGFKTLQAKEKYNQCGKALQLAFHPDVANQAPQELQNQHGEAFKLINLWREASSNLVK